METDDDMIVVIVGDGENEEFPAPVKEDMLDGDEVEKLIESAATHGELVDGFIKEDVEEHEEFEDDSNQWDGDCEEEYVPEGDDDDDDEYDAEDSANKAHNKHRNKMLSPAQQKSFVKELRDRYPELQEDSNALVTTMSEIMRNVKPSSPPRDYFIMNGIMFECVFCGTISETQPAARRHYHDKHGERYLICFACGVDFRSTPNLYKHEKRCTAPDAVMVLKARARALGRKGRSRPYIPKHFPDNEQRKKPRERKYLCSQCSASFVCKAYLRSHEMLHRGLRPFRCHVCPCAYTSLTALSRHHKKHSDEKYECDSCGRAFKAKTALIAHMDTHLPVKKFGCERCEKRYVTKAALGRHVQSKHLKLPPPYVCKICYKRYKQMSVLKEHTKKDHGLLLMTRRMFFTSLPMLTETQIGQAKVVLKSEMEQDYCLQPLDNTSMPKLPVETPDELPGDMPDALLDQPDGSNLLEPIWKVEPLKQDSNAAEHSIVLSKEVFEEGFDEGENYNVVVIQDGEVINLNY